MSEIQSKFQEKLGSYSMIKSKRFDQAPMVC